MEEQYFPGNHKGHDVDIVSIFEAVGKQAAGTITQDELEEVESCAIPGAGSCGGMYTANTMASAIEAMGMSLPNSSAQEAVSEDKVRDCVQAGETVLRLIEKIFVLLIFLQEKHLKTRLLL